MSHNFHWRPNRLSSVTPHCSVQLVVSPGVRDQRLHQTLCTALAANNLLRSAVTSIVTNAAPVWWGNKHYTGILLTCEKLFSAQECTCEGHVKECGNFPPYPPPPILPDHHWECLEVHATWYMRCTATVCTEWSAHELGVSGIGMVKVVGGARVARPEILGDVAGVGVQDWIIMFSPPVLEEYIDIHLLGIQDTLVSKGPSDKTCGLFLYFCTSEPRFNQYH